VWNEIRSSMSSGIFVASSRAVQLAVNAGLPPRIGANLIAYAALLGRDYGMLNGHAGSPLCATASGELALPAEDRQALETALEAFRTRLAAEPDPVDDVHRDRLYAELLPQLVAATQKNDAFNASLIESHLALLDVVSPLYGHSEQQVDQLEQLQIRAFQEARPVSMKELVERLEAALPKGQQAV
jgi:hypothetical protein